MDEYSEEVTVFMHMNNIRETLGMVSLATLAIHNDQLRSLADHADFEINAWLTHSYATLQLILFTFHMFFTKQEAPYMEMTSNHLWYYGFVSVTKLSDFHEIRYRHCLQKVAQQARVS